jgi:hypothetical protein
MGGQGFSPSQQSFGSGLQPQPDYSLPQAGGYQTAPVQNYQQMQPMQQMQHMQPMPAPPGQFVPQPSTPLPPAPPQMFPAQGSTTANKPSMFTRVSSVFRKGDKPQPANQVRSAGWSRPVQQ